MQFMSNIMNNPTDFTVLLNQGGKTRVLTICNRMHQILTPLKGTRFESPSYIKRFNKLQNSSVKRPNLSIQDNLSPKRLSLIVQGSPLRSQDLRLPQNSFNTFRLYAKLPHIKLENI
jgi:hypothetical protein